VTRGYFLQILHRSLIQEFVSHDACLYKVYVLGNHVSVHQRCSLPNIPNNVKRGGYFLFDSQQPHEYALLSESMDTESKYSPTEQSSATISVETVKPVVECLRQAFSLNLFGFDLLLRTSDVDCDGGVRRKELMVVDVNYFPSYKEVSSFPSLLAEFLVETAQQKRINDVD